MHYQACVELCMLSGETPWPCLQAVSEQNILPCGKLDQKGAPSELCEASTNKSRAQPPRHSMLSQTMAFTLARTPVRTLEIPGSSTSDTLCPWCKIKIKLVLAHKLMAIFLEAFRCCLFSFVTSSQLLALWQSSLGDTQKWSEPGLPSDVMDMTT